MLETVCSKLFEKLYPRNNVVYPRKFVSHTILAIFWWCSKNFQLQKQLILAMVYPRKVYPKLCSQIFEKSILAKIFREILAKIGDARKFLAQKMFYARKARSHLMLARQIFGQMMFATCKQLMLEICCTHKTLCSQIFVFQNWFFFKLKWYSIS